MMMMIRGNNNEIISNQAILTNLIQSPIQATPIKLDRLNVCHLTDFRIFNEHINLIFRCANQFLLKYYDWPSLTR